MRQLTNKLIFITHHEDELKKIPDTIAQEQIDHESNINCPPYSSKG